MRIVGRNDHNIVQLFWIDLFPWEELIKPSARNTWIEMRVENQLVGFGQDCRRDGVIIKQTAIPVITFRILWEVDAVHVNRDAAGCYQGSREVICG